MLSADTFQTADMANIVGMSISNENACRKLKPKGPTVTIVDSFTNRSAKSMINQNWGEVPCDLK